mmetsp:Transcript_225/g.947  ORF Transcript_225/g.947 Transcript_225/m.947 type:complete len:693 (-) Transcript_225:134-2212(-)
MSFGSSQRHKMFLGARPGPCSLALRHSAPRCDARIEAEGVAESQLRRRPAPPRAERAPLHCSPARPLGYRRASSSWASRRSSTPWSTCGRSYLCPSSRRCSVQPSSAPSSRSRAPVDSSVLRFHRRWAHGLPPRGHLSGVDIKSLKSYLAPGGEKPPEKWPLRAGTNALLAAVTLGSGASLGPEAPAAVLGANAAFAVFQLFAQLAAPSPAVDVAAAEAGAAAGAAPDAEARQFIDTALSGSKIVADMSSGEIDMLEKFFRKVELRMGDVLMNQGDDVRDDEPGLYVTQGGELDVFVKVDTDKDEAGQYGKKVASYSGGGKLLGELAVLFRAPRAASVVATSDCVLWSVDRSSFRAAGGRSQGAMKSLYMSPDSVVASGAAAGVAAGFNAPIAGIFFASEVVRPKDENRLDLTTRLLAAALSAAVVSSFTGGGPAFLQNVDFNWRGGNLELANFALLGIVVGFVSYANSRVAAFAQSSVASIKEQGVPQNLLPFVGAIVTVIVSLCCSGRVQFDGFGALNEVLSKSKDVAGGLAGELSFQPLFESRDAGLTFTVVSLLGLMLSKIFATAFCQASGLVGGAFAPALFTGACLGAAFGRLAAVLAGGAALVSTTSTYTVVGASSMLAANCGVPVTSVVLAVELAGGSSYEATLPLIIGIALATYISSVLLPGLFEGVSREDSLKRYEQQAEDLV